MPSGEPGGIVGVMPTRRSADTIPDLFSATPTAKALESPGGPQGKVVPDNSAAQARYLLPKDLAGALKRLDDTEVDSLLAAVGRPSAAVACRGLRRREQRHLRMPQVH